MADSSSAETRSGAQDDSSVLSSAAKDFVIYLLKGVARQGWSIFVTRACQDPVFREQNVDSRLRYLVSPGNSQRTFLTAVHQVVLQCSPPVDEAYTIVAAEGSAVARPIVPRVAPPSSAPTASFADDINEYSAKLKEQERSDVISLIASAAAAATRGDSDDLTARLSRLNAYLKPPRVNVEAGSLANAEGLASFRRGTLADAASRFRSAIELDPGNIEARNNLAFMLIEMNSDNEAALVLTDVLKIAPYRSAAWLNAAQLLAGGMFDNLAVGAILIADRYSSNRATLHASLEKMLIDEKIASARRIAVKKALDVIDGRVALPL